MTLLSKDKMRIPNDWTTDQAKAVWEFLEDIISAIWDVHFHALNEAMKKERALLDGGPTSDDIADIPDEEDLPF